MMKTAKDKRQTTKGYVITPELEAWMWGDRRKPKKPKDPKP